MLKHPVVKKSVVKIIECSFLYSIHHKKRAEMLITSDHDKLSVLLH